MLIFNGIVSAERARHAFYALLFSKVPFASTDEMSSSAY